MNYLIVYTSLRSFSSLTHIIILLAVRVKVKGLGNRAVPSSEWLTLALAAATSWLA